MLISFTPFHEIWQMPKQPLNFSRNPHKKIIQSQTNSQHPFRVTTFTFHPESGKFHQPQGKLHSTPIRDDHRKSGGKCERVAGGWLTELSCRRRSTPLGLFYFLCSLSLIFNCHQQDGNFRSRAIMFSLHSQDPWHTLTGAHKHTHKSRTLRETGGLGKWSPGRVIECYRTLLTFLFAH